MWQCLFCNNQYRIEENKDAINESLGSIFKTRLLKIRKMVVLLDKFQNPKYLTRVWCVYEMYTAVTSPEVSIDFLLPPQQAAEIQDMIRENFKQIEQSFERVNSENATASKPADADKVKDEIRRSEGGFEAVDAKVVEKMKEWVKQQFDRLLNVPSPSNNKSNKNNKPKSGAAFLRNAGLHEDLVQKLLAAGVKTPEDLRSVKDDLVDMGLTKEEQHSVLQMFRPDSVPTTSRNWKAELLELGLPTHCFADLTEDEVLNKDNLDTLNFVQNKRFQEWRKDFRQERWEGQLVTEHRVALGLAVDRGPDWCYHAEDNDTTPEDGGVEAFGTIIGWRTVSGRATGPENDVPTHGGWVRVHWPVTGYQKTYRFSSAHDLKFASAEKVRSAANALETVGKGMLKLQHLRCDFGYRCGTRHPHYAKFDKRTEACEKVAGFVHGDVVKDSKDGELSTCIGLKYNPEKKQVEMWFHVKGSHGAGIYADIDLDQRFRKVNHVQLQEVGREEVDGASDGEIEHDDRDWVYRNLSPTIKYASKSGHILDVDTRSEVISKFRMPFKSGDVLRDKADGELMTCVGVACRPEREHRKVELWFHTESSKGAGVVLKIHKNLGRHEVVRNEPVVGTAQRPKVSKPEGGVKLNGQLQCDFSFPSGIHFAEDELFDVREEIVEKITGWTPGTVLSLGSPEQTVTLIGLRPEPLTGEPQVWWHFQDGEDMHPGAGMLPSWESMDLQETGQHVELPVLRELLKSKPSSNPRRGIEGLMSQLGSLGGGHPLEAMLQQALRREL